MRNFRSFADILNQFPTGESPTNAVDVANVPQATMPDHLAMDAQDEAAPKSALEENMARQVLNKFTGITADGTMAKPSRSPATQASPEVEETPETKQKNELGKLELLMQKMNEQRKAEIQDAQSRQMKAQMLKGLTDNVGLMVGGAQAMNTKAAVTPAKVSGFDPGDLTAIVERKFKPEQEQLLAQYKELKDKNGELSEKDKAYLALGYKQLELGGMRREDANNRFYIGEDNRMYKFGENMREKQELTPAQAKEIIGVDTTIDSLHKLDGMKDFSTGPLAGRLEKIKRYVGVSPGNRVAMQAQLNMIVSQYGKAVSGSQIGEGEFARIQSQLPNENDSDEQFAAKLANFRDALQDSRDRLIYTYKVAGKNPGELSNRKEIDEIRGSNKNQSTPADDPRIDKFMQNNPKITDRNQAIKILKDAGKI